MVSEFYYEFEFDLEIIQNSKQSNFFAQVQHRYIKNKSLLV
jgi:hypothetical protein